MDSVNSGAIRIVPVNSLPQRAVGILKQTYEARDGGLRPTEPAPLVHDILSGNDEGRWPPGSDFAFFKQASDVVVRGSAFARQGKPVSAMRVHVRVGKALKRLQVFGDRLLEWTDGGLPRIGAPEAFTSVELTRANAYGGVDPRFPLPAELSPRQLLQLLSSYPGAYPRNIEGKGYVAIDSPTPAVALPNVEDPEELLTADTVVAAPERWYRQPMPWFLEWQLPSMFPRSYFAGARPRWVPSGNEIAEVRRGYLSERWRDLAANAGRPIPPAFYQEASLGMTFSDLREGTPFELVGMHPEHERLTFALPRFPLMEIEVEGDRQPVEAKLLHVVITPHEEKVEITWAGIREELPRAFFPGIHGEIPITLHADGETFPFEAPEPIYEKIKKAEEEGRMPSRPRPRRPGEPGYLEIMGELLPDERPQRERDQVGHAQAPRFGAIDPIAGRLLLEEIDWVLPGATPYAFRRFYSSSMAWRAGELGLGWSHSLEQAIWEEHGWVLYRVEDGREIGMPLPDGELGLGASVHHPNAGVTIVRIASDAYEVRLADGGRHAFTRIEQSVASGPPRARLTRSWLADGMSLEIRYDTHGRLDRLTLPGGSFLRFEHDERGRLIRLFAPTVDGRDHAVAARYSVDASGQLREAVDGSGRATKYRYQGRLLVEHQAPTGLVRRFAYDGVGAGARCVSERWGDEAREVLWSPDERVVGLVDAEGSSFSARADAAYRIERVLDRFGNELARDYDETSGLLSRQRDPSGETTYLHDAAWHLAEVTAPDGGSVALDHDAVGRLTRHVDADGHAAERTWDHLGRLTAAVERDGTSVIYLYEGEGPLKSVTAPGDRLLRLERDPKSQAVVAIDAEGSRRHARRDAQGRITEIRDELGNVSSFRYGASGRPSELQTSDDLRLSFETDPDGRITRLHDGARELKLERDSWGRLEHVDEGGAGPRLHRDANGHVKMVESEAFDYWELRRDAAGRIQEESGFGEVELHFLRDHAGRIRREMSGPVRTEVERDAAGRPMALEHADETFQRFRWSKGGRLVRAQDADRVTRFDHDGAGRVSKETTADSEVASRYDSSGRRVGLDSGGLSVRIERDAIGGATSFVAIEGERRLELAFARDAAGRETARELPGGLSQAWTRDALGRPTRRGVRFGERELAATEISWRGASRVVRIVESRGARELKHDARGRLVQVGSLVRALDEVGHVFRSTARDDHRYEHGRLVEAYGTTYEYDGSGRRTVKRTALGDEIRYRWDAASRLVAVEPSDDVRIAYDYDGLGRLVRRRRENRVEIPGVDEPVWEPTSQTDFVWDGLTLLHEIVDRARTTWLWEAGALVGKIAPDGVFAVLTDHLGVPTELSDLGGNLAWRGTVDAFGTVTLEKEQTRNPWRLPGHWEDPDTGLQHAWLRVYDPETGAYLSPNPLGVAAGADLYGYLPDPLSETSPLGLGRGYATFGGELAAERLASELIDRAVRALDRGDGAAGPRARFDRDAASWMLPDPEAMFWGPWESYRPSRRRMRYSISQPRDLRAR